MIENIQDMESMLSTHFISASLFLSLAETYVLSALPLLLSKLKKHEEFKIVIKPPVIQGLTFTSKAFCFLSYQGNIGSCVGRFGVLGTITLFMLPVCTGRDEM